MQTRERELLVFAKYPHPGKVNTRLIGMLTPQQAAELHRACVRDTLAVAGAVGGCRKRLLVAAPLERAQRLAAELRANSRWRVGVQGSGSLGQRLELEFSRAFVGGARKAIVIGTDTPWMDPQRIYAAFRLLDRADVVVGPTEDGGYYLLGARRWLPEMFRGIDWGTERVLRQTLERLREIGASVRRLPRDFDLDRPDDLRRAAALVAKKKTRAQRLAWWIREWEEITGSSLLRRPPRRSKTRPLGPA